MPLSMTFLDDNKLDLIERTAFRVLDEIGMQVDAPEILDVGCLCADVDHFIKKIMENVAKDYVDVNYNNIQKYNIKAIISQYDDMFSRVFR